MRDEAAAAGVVNPRPPRREVTAIHAPIRVQGGRSARAAKSRSPMKSGSTPSRDSVAIVGAGPGGLAAAVLLAASGVRVTIYESQPALGGRSGRLEVDGFRFDRGPTFFMMPYVLEEIIASAPRFDGRVSNGIASNGSVGPRATRLGDLVDLRRLDPMYRLVIGQPDRGPLTIDATQDLARMVKQFEAVAPGDGAGFLRFMADNRTKLRLMTPILRKPITSLFDLMTLDGIKVAPKLKPWSSLYDHLRGYFSNESVRLAMSFQSKYLGMSPFECPSLFSILPFIEYEYGIWHPIGGCHALMQALAETAISLGVEIRLGSPVTALKFEGRRIRGLCAGNTWHEHSHVIVNADASWALKNLVPESLRGRETDRAIDARRYSCSTFMMYLGVKGEVELPHHTIYTSASYRENLADISSRGRLSDDPSIYVCNPSRIDPTMAPRGMSSLYVLVPTPNTKAAIDWRAETPRLRRAAYEQIERALGVEGLERRVVSETLFTPEDWRAMNINHGAAFNLAHSLPQMLHRRPQHRLPGFDGLWLVGGGTHPGSGLPVIFLSSQITAELVCREMGVAYAGARALPPSAEMSTPAMAMT